jgi:hypothetical protein
VGVEQVKALAEARAAFVEALDIVACDGKYGNAGFLRSVKGLRCGITTRLRADRVLYRPAPVHDPHQKGRPRVHGARFAFKEADTWGEPDEVIELEDPRWGQVRLQRWKDLHEKKGVDALRCGASLRASRTGKTACGPVVGLVSTQDNTSRDDHHRRNHLAGIR